MARHVAERNRALIMAVACWPRRRSALCQRSPVIGTVTSPTPTRH